LRLIGVEQHVAEGDHQATLGLFRIQLLEFRFELAGAHFRIARLFLRYFRLHP
jgi:hypothetical protein